MNKKFLLLILAQVGIATMAAEDQASTPEMSFVMGLEYDLDTLLDRIGSMEDYADTVFKEVTRAGDSVSRQTGQAKAAVSQDDDFVLISFNISGLDIAKLDFEVEGKTLKGAIPFGDRNIKIEVTDGVLMVSSHVSYDEKTRSADGDKQQTYEHASTQMMSLPSRVSHLEDTSLEYDNDYLVLKLPRFKEEKQETRKLSVTVK
ncbi:MAG TPA: hypothetical protein QGF02_02150 [Candidatus Babeliales bacterium]|nr:hypothetical protein [Candidatus Babeliales bacterium]